jgi:hypothetical protein
MAHFRRYFQSFFKIAMNFIQILINLIGLFCKVKIFKDVRVIPRWHFLFQTLLDFASKQFH